MPFSDQAGATICKTADRTARRITGRMTGKITGATASAGRLLAAACALTIAGAGFAQASELRANYTVRLFGLSLGSATFSGVIGERDYELVLRARLNGLARVVSDARGVAQSSGNIRDGRILPNGYATVSSNSRESRTVRMRLAAGAVQAVEISPPIPERPDRVPLRQTHTQAVLDPLSALLAPVAAGANLTGPAACDRKLPVFDGYTRFDVTLRYAGVRTVETRGFRGQAVVCRARYRPVAGHRANRRETQFMVNNSNMEVWLAPVPGTRVLAPFRIAVATQAGMLEIDAHNFAVSPRGATAQR